jgi:IS5 family transposase
VLANWHPLPEGQRKRGGQRRYSDQALTCLLLLKAVYKLPYRQTIGFAQSILNLLQADVTVPDYTLLCKRSVDLQVDLSVSQSDEPKHVVIDSSGLKVYGDGEWKVRQHGYSKRRTWRKLHLSVNESTQEIEAVALTEAGVDDAEMGEELLEETPGEIEQVSADGAYDKRKFYQACARRRVKRIVVPPRRDAKIWQHGNSKKPPLPRDQNLRHIRRVGRKRWKVASGYHRRSLAETAVYRVKTIFGNVLSTRTLARQITEVRVKAAALNRMTQLGMPDSYRVA